MPSYDAHIATEEKKAKRNAVVLTAVIAALLLLALLFIIVARDTVPPQDEIQYTLSGSMDFGDMNEGMADANTKDPVSDNPKPKTEQPTEAQPQPKSEDVLTTDQSDISTPSSDNTSEATTEPTDQVDNPLRFDGGGANDGDSNTAGNKGNPNAELADGGGQMGADGIYDIGLGNLDVNYDVPEEGTLIFRVWINSAGRVTRVTVDKAYGRMPTMTQRIQAAIKKEVFKTKGRSVEGMKVRVRLKQR